MNARSIPSDGRVFLARHMRTRSRAAKLAARAARSHQCHDGVKWSAAVAKRSFVLMQTIVRSYLAAPNAGAAIDGQGHAGDEVGFVGGEEEGSIGDVPGRAHLPPQRHLAVALGLDLR